MVKDDTDNTATLSYDGKILRFYFNGLLVGEKEINKKRVIGNGRLEIAPIAANSMRNSIQELVIMNKSVVPQMIQKSAASFYWEAPVPKKSSLNVQKIIREAGPNQKYQKNFIMKQ